MIYQNPQSKNYNIKLGVELRAKPLGPIPSSEKAKGGNELSVLVLCTGLGSHRHAWLADLRTLALCPDVAWGLFAAKLGQEVQQDWGWEVRGAGIHLVPCRVGGAIGSRPHWPPPCPSPAEGGPRIWALTSLGARATGWHRFLEPKKGQPFALESEVVSLGLRKLRTRVGCAGKTGNMEIWLPDYRAWLGCVPSWPGPCFSVGPCSR